MEIEELSWQERQLTISMLDRTHSEEQDLLSREAG